MERENQFIGQSLAFLDAVERASRAAPLDRPVLVIGERGTGKELIAERLHHLSSRWAGPLIIMNCAALPETLIEAELFGHEAGPSPAPPRRATAASRRPTAAPCSSTSSATLVDAGAGPAAARDRIWRGHPHRRVASRSRSTSASSPRPTSICRGGRRGPVPRRPARPAVLRGRHPAAAARARRATSRCSPTISAGAWRSSSTGRTGRASARARWPSSKPTLARQRARAAQRRRARGLSPRGSRAADRRDPVRSVRFAVGAAAAGSADGALAPTAASGDRDRRGGTVAAPATAAAATSDFRGAVAAYERQLLEDALRRNRFNQRATAAALGLSYDQLRHALKRHKLRTALLSASIRYRSKLVMRRQHRHAIAKSLVRKRGCDERPLPLRIVGCDDRKRPSPGCGQLIDQTLEATRSELCYMRRCQSAGHCHRRLHASAPARSSWQRQVAATYVNRGIVQVSSGRSRRRRRFRHSAEASRACPMLGSTHGFSGRPGTAGMHRRSARRLK